MLTATGQASITCCGRVLQPLSPKRAGKEDELSVIKSEGDYYISSQHEMTRAHFISFVALLTGDSILLRKQYPEWDMQTRIPCFSHGMLVWYCTHHGLFYQPI